MGWQDGEVVAELAPRPAWMRGTPVEEAVPGGSGVVSGALRQHFQAQTRAAGSFEDYLQAGFQQSVTGLAARGKAPDVGLDENTPWYGRAAASVAGIVGDLPAMVPGFMAGAPAGAAAGSALPVIGNVAGAVVGGFAGAAALPAGLRAAMMEAYTKGEITSSADFIRRALDVAWETTKGAVVGGATGGAGIVAKAALPVAAGAVAQVVAPTAAQIAAMTTVGKALEGQLPEPQDFLDAAIVIGGMQAAGTVAGRLRTIYAKTGVPPEQVVADASRDPTIKAALTADRAEAPQPSEVSPPPPSSGAAVAEVRTALERTIDQVRQETDVPAAYKPLADAETARAIIPGDKAAKVAENPFALELPQAPGEPAKPTHVNYNLINTAEDTKLALARLSEVYVDEIQVQRRGTVSWEETSVEAARLLSDTLGGADARLLMPREPGTAAGAAEILARKQLTVGAAESMMAARDELLAKGAEATDADRLGFLQAIERSAMIQAEFLGARAEAGRALNILKSTAIEAERAKQIQEVIGMYGKDPMQLAAMLKEIDSHAGALAFAREAVKATTWEKIVEAWKAGMLSGPITHVRNVLGNTSFLVTRPFVDLAASGAGAFRSGADRVVWTEPLARVVGNVQGTMDAARMAVAAFRLGTDPGKTEIYRQANTGKVGAVVQVPFRFLQSADAFFKTLNERGEAYALAVRQASAELLDPRTNEFRERVATLVQSPDAAMLAEMKAAGERFTFNTPLGEAGQLVQKLVRASHTEFLFPFIRTPANILKETFRLTPLAPLLKEWREDVKAGGARADKALAEIAVGSAFMSFLFMAALDEKITGAGDPDAGKRRVKVAAGWQPYSVKIGKEYYSYQGLGPITTLMGMAADAANVWDHMSEEESDKIPKIIAVAFANAVTSQTALMGLTNVVNITGDPTRYSPTFLKGMAGSLVPALVAQPTAMLDPIAREVDSMLDAIKARIPGLRQGLLPKRDVFGEPIKTKDRLFAVSPVTVTSDTDDKVRSEASRLGVSIADTPKKTHIGRGTGKVGDVKLEPEERDRFAEVGGHLAHELLSVAVTSPGWDELPELAQKRTFEKVMTQAHRVGAMQAMSLDKRLKLAVEITEKVMQSLQPEEVR